MTSPAAHRQTQAMARHRLDLDPSRLTTFPMPGAMESASFQKEPPRSERPSSHMAPAAHNVPAPPHSTGNQQYWMPDHLCKACYDCEVPFSFFRRRHHCRLCGMIFCFECSDEFIDGAAHGHSGQIRVCKFCARFVDELERKMSIMNAPHRDALARSTSVGTSGGGTSNDTNSSGTVAADIATDTVSPLLGIPSTARAGDAAAMALDTTSTLTSLDSFVSVGSATNASFLDSPPSPEPDELAALPPLYTIGSSDAIDELPDDIVNDQRDSRAANNAVVAQRAFARSRPQHRRRRSSVELMGAIESGGLLESELQLLKAGDSESTAAVAANRSTNAPLSYRTKTDAPTQHEVVLDKYLHSAHDQIRMGIAQAVRDAASSLSTLSARELSTLATALEDVAFIVAGHALVSTRFRAANGFNYTRLVKVKSIATVASTSASTAPTLALPGTSSASPYQIQWLAGTLCRKRLSHKHMAQHVANPRILLFACGISYDRSAGAGRLNSLDTLLEQERSYMSILVDKITALAPDVVFVERTVSRHAQELLRARRVAIVLNVPFAVLERISRHTGAALLTSVDHVDKARTHDVVGTCRSFAVKSVPIVPDDSSDTDANSGGRTQQQLSSLVVQQRPARRLGGLILPTLGASRSKTETYLYLDGCDPLNGSTVLLTGPSKTELRVLKRVARHVLAMTYRLLLEAHVLANIDLNTTALVVGTSERADVDHDAINRHSQADDAAESRQARRVATSDTTWYTTCTLRVRDHSSVNIRYHPCTACKYFGITAYADEDISFGNFLTQEMAALLLKCQSPKCSYPMADHVQTFSCRTGTITVSFEELPLASRLPISQSLHETRSDTGGADALAAVGTDSALSRPALMKKLLGRDMNVMAMLTGIYDAPPLDRSSASGTSAGADTGGAPGTTTNSTASESERFPTIVFWRWCCACNAMVTPFVPLASYVYKYSFARFLEVLFLDAAALPAATPGTSLSSSCTHAALAAHVLFFNVGDWVARFDFAAHVPLRLASPTPSGTRAFSIGNTPAADASDADTASRKPSTVASAVTTRLAAMTELLATLIQLFTDKVRGIQQAVEAFERADDSLQTQIVLEVVCLKKLIQCDQLVFAHRIDKLAADAAHSLAECDAAQRSLYLLACRWIDRMLKLRKLIRTSLSTEATAAMASSSFTLAGFAFGTPTALSPIPSPRTNSSVRDDSEYAPVPLAPSAIARDSADFSWDGNDRLKRASSDNLSVNGADVSPESSVVGSVTTSSSASFASLEKKLSMSHALERSSTKSSSDLRDPSQSSWRTALWDLYRVLGRNAPGSDFQVDLPEALLAGHPSLPYRSGDNVVLVNHSEPITCVAYALSSDLYDEQLDSWKLCVHTEVAASAAAASVVQTNWSRAALETTLNTPFKYAISERPLHVSLLSGDSSGQSSSPWEFSTIAYYPLQFEVLRELFFGALDSFLFSIAHVQHWDANGGKSGASFYRTLDDRFVVKHISSTELQSFLEVLPGYFKYMSSVYFDGRASVISKTVGLYQTMITRKDTGQRTVHYIAVTENVFAHRRIARTYDLKGSSRNRYIKPSDAAKSHHCVLLDGNLLESSRGHPIGVLAEGHHRLVTAVQNDAAFLNSINIVDYSMVVGIGANDSSSNARSSDDNVGSDGDVDGDHMSSADRVAGTAAASTEMTVGIIDYYRQFDLLKRVESVSKSVGMIAGQSSPTIIEPALYGKRFEDAINRYFMPVSPVSSSANAER